MSRIEGVIRKVMLVLGFTSIPHVSFADDDTLLLNNPTLPDLVFNDGDGSSSDPFKGLCDDGDMPQVDKDRKVVACISKDGSVTGAAPLE